MPKIIRGKRDVNGIVTLRGGQGGIRKLQCPSCHQMISPSQQSDGKMRYSCACGAVYSVKPL
jgi:hypothetical protein